ncbi:MAG: hypothetical protein DRG78_17190 [Epsilonproteobacteria bacterium]|nr:MAG: hypothetical protein DRG78_17190 [Campylobacterota bacterium]
MLATNRQKKVLNFFKKSYDRDIKDIISNLKKDIFEWEKWEKYIYYTNDFDTTSEELINFDMTLLKDIELPNDWQKEKERKKKLYIKEQAKIEIKQIDNNSYYDSSPLDINFKNKRFVLTGGFSSGKKSDIEKSIKNLGGITASKISLKTDYLVQGTKDKDNLNNSIATAIDNRKNYGIPAIILEIDLIEELEANS